MKGGCWHLLSATVAAVFLLAVPGEVTAAEDRVPGAARLAVPGLPDVRPGALADLMADVEENSSVRPDRTVPDIAPESPLLFDRPFVVLSGNRAFAPLSDRAVANLRLYLREGGFLFVDDATGLKDSPFMASVERDLARILPGTPLEPVGRDHAVYRSFFLLRGIVGRLPVERRLRGMWLGDITPVLISANDLLGSVQRALGGGYALDVVPGGMRQRIEATKLGINLTLFALTGNYKRDVIHVQTLLKRMRRQGGYGE